MLHPGKQKPPHPKGAAALIGFAAVRNWMHLAQQRAPPRFSKARTPVWMDFAQSRHRRVF